MESQRPAHWHDRPSLDREGAAPGDGARSSAAFLGVFARPDEPAPARARDLPARGIWGAGPGTVGPGRVELRPLRGSHLETDRGGAPELVTLEGWWSGRRDRCRGRPPGRPRHRRGPPRFRRRVDLRPRTRPAGARLTLARSATRGRAPLCAPDRDAQRAGI